MHQHQITIYNSDEEKSSTQAENYTACAQTVCRYLAYRDLPNLFKKYVQGSRALDYGSGTGISSLFLVDQGFSVSGVDVSKEMVAQAQKQNPSIPFHIIDNGMVPFISETFDLIFSSFVLFELSKKEDILAYLIEAKRVLKKDGVLVILTGSQEMYSGDWLVFKTFYPNNKALNSGDKVKILLPDANMEFTDYYWTEDDYFQIFKEADLEVVEKHYPLGRAEEPYQWKEEKRHSPFVIFVAKQRH